MVELVLAEEVPRLPPLLTVELLREVLVLAVELLRDVPLLPAREVLALLREPELELLLRVELVDALLRFEELLERLAELLERLLLPELLMVPPTALETDDEDELRLPLLTEEELRDELEDEEERDVV